MILKLLRVDHERYRAVIDKFDLHVGPKLPGCDGNALSLDGMDERFIERNSDGRRSGIDETGAAAFTAIAVEGELADDQDAAAGFGDIEVHFAVGVAKDSEARDLVGQPVGAIGRVVMRHAEQDEQPPADLADDVAFDADAGFGDSLNEGTHFFSTTEDAMSGEQPKNYTANQQKIIKRYYDNISDIKHERLAELVGELYLAEGKKKEKVWQTTGETMAKLGVPAARVEHLLKQRKPELIAELVKEMAGKK